MLLRERIGYYVYCTLALPFHTSRVVSLEKFLSRDYYKLQIAAVV